MNKKILSIVLCAILALSCLVLASCTFFGDEEEEKDAVLINDEEENKEPNEDDTHQYYDNIADVSTLEGTPLVSNMSYKMPTSSGMVFAVPTAYSRTAYDGITLTATVEPSYAAYKAVDWLVSFVDPDSTWATGKEVTDYITITPESDGSLTAVVECKEAFAEQIIVTVVSRANPNAKDSCTIDYARRIEDMSIYIGDDIELKRGDNYVQFETATGHTGKGGKITFDVDFTDVYTLDSLGSVSTDLSQWSLVGFETENMLSGLNSDGVRFTGAIMYNEIASTMNITFDVDSLRYVTNYMLQNQTTKDYIPLNEMAPEEIINIIESGRTTGDDTLLTLHIIRPDNYRYVFNIKAGDLIDSGTVVQSISLNQTEHAFNQGEV